MKGLRYIAWRGLAATVAASSLLFWWSSPAGADDPEPAPLERPVWRVGDQWIIETLTQKVQGREAGPARNPARVRWQFAVAGIEQVAGRDCYRVDIHCLAKGRLRPATSIWCDQDTLFLRQFQTQLAGDGRLYTLQESYDSQDGKFSPVLPPVTALPLGLPAFAQQQAKSTGEFSYLSQPAPAGSKDAGLIRFSHEVKQVVRVPGAKSLQMVPESYSKDLEQKPVSEVELSDSRQTVVQLWKKTLPGRIRNNG